MITYLNERFPIQLVMIFSVSYSLMLLGISGQLIGAAVNFVNVGLVALSFTAFLLRLRVTDEFKDINHDSKNYPDRPFQRGAISSINLIVMGFISLIIELGSLYIISPNAIMAYLPVFLYSALTAKEFFISGWLNKHFTIYFISHQLIFFAFVVWGFLTFEVPLNIRAIYGIVAFILTMSIFEIIRKLEYRHDKKGKIVKDSYPAVWGVFSTITLLIVMLVSVGISLTVITGNVWHLLLALTSVLFTYSENFKLIQSVIGLSLAVQGILLFI